MLETVTLLNYVITHSIYGKLRRMYNWLILNSLLFLTFIASQIGKLLFLFPTEGNNNLKVVKWAKGAF